MRIYKNIFGLFNTFKCAGCKQTFYEERAYPSIKSRKYFCEDCQTSCCGEDCENSVDFNKRDKYKCHRCKDVFCGKHIKTMRNGNRKIRLCNYCQPHFVFCSDCNDWKNTTPFKYQDKELCVACYIKRSIGGVTI